MKHSTDALSNITVLCSLKTLCKTKILASLGILLYLQFRAQIHGSSVRTVNLSIMNITGLFE